MFLQQNSAVLAMPEMTVGIQCSQEQVYEPALRNMVLRSVILQLLYYAKQRREMIKCKVLWRT